MSPWDRSRYPDDWDAIARRVKDQAGWRCQCVGQCGLAGHSPCGVRHGETVQFAAVDRDGRRMEGKAVLTVAHWPDPDPMNCADGNLVATCASCHLRMDRDHHVAKASATRARNMAVGTEPLFGEAT